MIDITSLYITKDKKDSNPLFERYSCIHTKTGIYRDMVLVNHFLSQHPQFREKFQSVIEEVKEWEHPGLEKIIEYGEFKNRVSYVSDTRDEQPLSGFLDTRITISVAEIMSVAIVLLDIVKFFNSKQRTITGVSLEDIKLSFEGSIRLTNYPVYLAISSLPPDTTGLLLINQKFYPPEFFRGIEYHKNSNLYWWAQIVLSMFPDYNAGRKPHEFLPQELVPIFTNLLNPEPDKRWSIERVYEEINQFLKSTLGESTTDFLQKVAERQKKLVMKEKQDRLFGRFRIIKELGRGGMGVVFQGYDEILERYVAIKRIPIKGVNPSRIESIKEEAKLIAKLNHPAIVNVFDVFEDEDFLYIIMEYVEGLSLEKIISRGVKLPFERIIDMIMNVAYALEYAHDRGIVHRDIKPANILITRTGAIKLVDFGIAGLIEVKEENMKGTPAYMSPEQIQGEHVDNRTDIFSLGVVFYQLLSGKNPFLGENLSETIYNILNKTPEKIDKLSGKLWNIITKMLEKDPEKRYSHIRDFINDIKVHKIYKEPEKKKRTWVILTLPFLVLGILFLGYLFLNEKFSLSKVYTVEVKGTVLKGIRRDGKIAWRRNVGDSITFLTPFIDFDKDGRKEVIVGTAESENITHGASGYLINSKGEIVWQVLNFSRYFKKYEEESLYVKSIDVEDISYKTPVVIFNVMGVHHSLLLFVDFFSGEELYRLIQPGEFFSIYATDIDKDSINEFIITGKNSSLGNKSVVFALDLEVRGLTEEAPPWEVLTHSEKSAIIWYTLLPGDGEEVTIIPSDTLFIIKTESKSFSVDPGGRILYRDSLFIGGTLKDSQLWNLLKEIKKRQFKKYEKILLSLVRTKDASPFIKAGILYYLAERLFKDEKYRDVEKYLKKAISLDPDFKQPYRLLSTMYEKQGRYNSAIKYFKKVMKKDNIEDLKKLVELYMVKGDINSALPLLEERYLSGKERGEIDIYYARILHLAGELDRAISIYEMAMKYGSMNHEGIVYLADAYVEKGENVNRADSLLKSIIQEDTSAIPVYGYIMGWVDYRRRRYKEAYDKISASLNYYRAYEKLNPSYRLIIPEIIYRKAMVLKTLGRKQELKSLLKEVKKYPLFGYYKDKIKELEKKI